MILFYFNFSKNSQIKIISTIVKIAPIAQNTGELSIKLIKIKEVKTIIKKNKVCDFIIISV